MKERQNQFFMRQARALASQNRESPVFISQAPGRLDVMGGIADYSGSLVLQQTIHEATFVALQLRVEKTITISSVGRNEGEATRTFSLSLHSLLPDGEPLEYSRAAAMYRSPEIHWASYVIGVLLVLIRERGLKLNCGLNILVGSEVPEGKGVASSAALEVAVIQAMCAAFDLQVQPENAALLCQKAENLVAGAPCGIMDQMASMCGEANALLALVCQPAELLPSVPIPSGIRFWGIDSGERHAVSGSDYGSVRTGAFMGLRILTQKSDPWNGFLANVDPLVFEKDLQQLLPEEMTGRDFLNRYGGTSDSVTTVHPDRIYKIRKPTAHPIYENARVQKFRRALLQDPTSTNWSELGNWVYESHASYSSCGLGSKGTDMIVNLVREAGPKAGLYGARITGGGSGGTVAVIGSAESATSVADIARKYEALTGYRPYVFDGSSPGAAQSGTWVLET